MTLSSFTAIGIAVIVIIMIFLILKSNKSKQNNKPYLLSKISLSLIILNWFIYLTDFYLILSQRLGDLVIHINFLPVWILLSIMGFIAAYKEFNNNRNFAVMNGGLAIINSIIGIIAWGIGNM